MSIDNFINNILPNRLQKTRTDEMVDLEIYTEKQMNKTKKQVIKCINRQGQRGSEAFLEGRTKHRGFR